MMYIRIADICFEIEREVELEKAFRKFRINRPKLRPDIKIKIAKGKPVKPKEKNLLLKSDGFWSIYVEGKKRIVIDSFNRKDHLPLRTAVFKHDFSSGTVYSDTVSNPLSYPIGTVLLSNFLAKSKGIILHASAVKIKEGSGYIFCGYSGSGKSTLAKLWSREAVVLNDDRIILRKINRHFYVYGCPWHTSDKNISAERARIKKIFFIRHAKKNSLEKLNKKEVNSLLLRHTYLPVWDRNGLESNFRFIEDLTVKCSFYKLGFLPRRSAVKFIQNI